VTLFQLINAADAVTLYARCVSEITGANFQPTDISSVSVTVYDLDGDTSTTVSPAPSVSDVVQAELSTTNWTTDKTGWNVGYTVDGSNFPSCDNYYRAVLTLTPYSGQPQQIVAQIQTRSE
jgi:hypothetical protein